MDRPTAEEEVRDPILRALRGGAVLTTQEITRLVKTRIEVVDSDRLRAARRENETKLDQIIANALQSGRKLCRDGLIERVGRGQFRITLCGEESLTRDDEDRKIMGTIFDNIVGETQ